MKATPFLNLALFLKAAILSFLLSTTPSFTPLLAQPDDNEITEAVKSVAKYTQASTDKTGQLLQSYGYSPPVHLQREWNQYPAVKKIEIAYKSAETANVGGGDKLLAMLSKDMAQKYEGINSEQALSKYLDGPNNNTKVSFKHPTNFNDIKISADVKKGILAISKYSDAGALGGVRGILRNHFGIPDNKLYDIISQSKSNADALQKGIFEAKSPPSPKERLQNVANHLYKHYEGARTDKGLKSIFGDPPNNSSRISNSTNRISSTATNDRNQLNRTTPRGNSPSTTSPTRSAGSNISNQSITRYNNFLSENYGNRSSGTRAFRNTVRIRGGFGGVIFGNEVKADPSLSKPVAIRWIPNQAEKNSLQSGDLEFILEDGSERVVPSVLLEDVYSGYKIAYDNPVENEVEDAHGLAGIYDSRYNLADDIVQWEVIIHPVIERLELGLGALMSDVFPIADKELTEKIVACKCDPNSMVDKWLANNKPSTWKITDVPMRIEDDGSLLKVSRLDGASSTLNGESALITMYAFSWAGESSQEDDSFYSIVPFLTSGVEAYGRINDFAKVFALIRWAKIEGATFKYPPTPVDWVRAPEKIWIKNGKMLFNPTTEDIAALNPPNNRGERNNVSGFNGSMTETYVAHGGSASDNLEFETNELRHPGVYYRIQLELTDQFDSNARKYRFIQKAGMKMDTEYLTKEGKIRVLISGFKSEKDAVNMMTLAQNRGFSSAFIVFYKNGIRYGKLHVN